MGFSVLYQIGEYFYFVLFGYFLLYLLFFARPLLRYVWGRTFEEDVGRLGDLIRKAEEEGPPASAQVQSEEREDNIEERRKELAEELQTTRGELEEARQKQEEKKEQGDRSTARELETAIIPELEEHLEKLNREMDALADGDEDPGGADPDEATVRLENLRVLNADYRHPFVKDAVNYLRAKFPRAEYQHFEVEPLPSVSKYLERISMARNMAGSFVLLGLLGTMIKLDGVVDQIAGLANTSQMQPEEFLGQMGTLMQGVEGAFLNSIIGVFLGVFALVLVGLLNRSVQRRIDRLDHTMSQEVLPGLARVHNQLMPERTLADLLRGTGDRIDHLDGTIEQLESRMSGTIGTLSGEIENMLERFGRYEEHYDLINDQVKALDRRGDSLEQQSERLRVQTEQLAEAGDRIAAPVNEMNETLRTHLERVSELQEDEYLQQVLEDIEEALQEERKAREEQLQDIRESNRKDQQQLLETIREFLEEETAAREEYVEDLLEQNADLRQRILDQQDALQGTLDAQHEEVAQRLEETAEALQASSPEQLSRMLQEINEASDRLNESSKLLSETAGNVSNRIDRSAVAMEQAAQSLNRVAQFPTFFAWCTRSAWPSVKSSFYSAIGKDEKARRIERRIPANGMSNGASNGHPAGEPRSTASGRSVADAKQEPESTKPDPPNA